jgi:AraC family transcriptional regulator
MWEGVDDNTINELKINVKPLGLISASTNFSEGRMEEKAELDHYIGVSITEDECPESLSKLEVAASNWEYLKQLDLFLRLFKMYGVVFIPNGFRRTNRWS